jgi:hypothetical protein
MRINETLDFIPVPVTDRVSRCPKLFKHQISFHDKVRSCVRIEQVSNAR